MKGLVHKVYIPIYKTHIRVCFHTETMEKHCNDDLSGADGYTWWPQQSDTIWIYLEKNDEGFINCVTAAHECFHVADFIFERTGMEIQEGSGNEHMAYLIGHLMDLVLNALDFDNNLENK